MDDKTVIQIAGLIIGAVVTGIMGFLLKGIWTLIASVIDNTKETAALKDTYKEMKEEIKALPKMKDDINAAHARIRKVEETLNG